MQGTLIRRLSLSSSSPGQVPEQNHWRQFSYSDEDVRGQSSTVSVPSRMHNFAATTQLCGAHVHTYYKNHHFMDYSFLYV